MPPRRSPFGAEIDRARAGDRVALDRLLHRIELRLEHLVHRRLGPELRTRIRNSDILQDAYLEIIKRLPSFRGDSESGFNAWVATLLENVIRHTGRHLHAQKRTQPRTPSAARDLVTTRNPPVPTPSTHALRSESLILVGEALETLRDDYRRVIVLAILEERPFDEVARVLGRSEHAARMLLSRARTALNLAIEKLEADRD